MADFWNMGGYAAFIWPSYGVAAIVLLGLGLTTLAANRRIKQETADLGSEDAGDAR